VPDPVIRASCLAHFIATLTRVDPLKTLEASDSLHSLANGEFKKNVELLLQNTAEQFVVVRDAIEALAVGNLDLATEVARSLNTEYRRDEAYETICQACISAKVDLIPLSRLQNVLINISDVDARDELVHDLVRRVSRSKEVSTGEFDPTQIVPFIQRATEIGDAHLRTRACSAAIRILAFTKRPEFDGLKSHVVSVLHSSWQAIDDDWLRVSAGFSISNHLAESDRDLALEYMRRANTFRDELPQREEDETYSLSVRLALRSFSGLLNVSDDTEGDWYRVEQAVEKVPSIRERIRLWTDLSLKCFRDGKNRHGQRTVNERVKPLLAAIRQRNATQWARSLVCAAPALYSAHKGLGLEAIAQIPREWKDLAYDEIIEFLLKREPSSEPFDTSSGRYAVTYDTAIDICEVMSLVSADWMIYRHTENLVESLQWRVNKATQEHKIDIARRLQKLIVDKLPNPRFIKHHGFKVVALAQLCRLQRIASDEWNRLVEQGRAIPNAADRAMVLSVLGKCCSDPVSQQKLFREARECITLIPCILDRADRLQILAGECLESDQVLCRQTLRDAMSIASTESNGDPELNLEFSSVRRRIIDLAHVVSEELASSLVSELDNDPGRVASRREAKDHLKLLDLKKTLIEEALDVPDLSTYDPRIVGRAAWLSLGSLLSGRTKKPIRVHRTHGIVQIAAQWPLADSYPVLAWIIENANVQLRGESGNKILRALFNSTMLSVDLIGRMLQKTASQLRRSQPFVMSSMSSDSLIIRAGEREKALKHLDGWLKKTATEYLKISDPYLGPEEIVAILQMVLCATPEIQISFLTSKKYQAECTDYEGLYSREWRKFNASSAESVG
jgi:hypothetical protein